MTRAMQGRTAAQDFNDASLWYGMVGEHFKETNFDDFIRPAASKMLSQIEMTGAPLDGSALESQLSKELSARVGWDVSGQIHNLFASNPSGDVDALKRLAQHGISQSFLDLSNGFAQMATTQPAGLILNRQQPRLQEVAFSGGQSSPTYPPPPIKPPIIVFCKVLGTIAASVSGSGVWYFLSEGCIVGGVPTGGISCLGAVAIVIGGFTAAVYAESYC